MKTIYTRFILCIFAVLMVISMFGCSKEEQIGSLGDANAGWVDEPVMMGSGKTLFDVEVMDSYGNVKKFKVATNKETVGEALEELDFIEIESHDHGIHITMVNGIEASDKTKTHWEFYIDGEKAKTSPNQTEINKYAIYSFKIED